MAYRRDCDTMGLMRIAERGAPVEQPAQAALAELATVALQLLRRQAVDDQYQHQFWRCGRGRIDGGPDGAAGVAMATDRWQANRQVAASGKKRMGGP